MEHAVPGGLEGRALLQRIAEEDFAGDKVAELGGELAGGVFAVAPVQEVLEACFIRTGGWVEEGFQLCADVFGVMAHKSRFAGGDEGVEGAGGEAKGEDGLDVELAEDEDVELVGQREELLD